MASLFASSPENAIGEFASLIRDERENLIGTTLVLNDEADPVEIVDFELKTRGGYQPSKYEVTVSDGRRLCAYTAEDSVRGSSRMRSRLTCGTSVWTTRTTWKSRPPFTGDGRESR